MTGKRGLDKLLPTRKIKFLLRRWYLDKLSVENMLAGRPITARFCNLHVKLRLSDFQSCSSKNC